MPQHARCATTMARFRATAAQIAMALPQIEPPTYLIGRLLAAADAERHAPRG